MVMAIAWGISMVAFMFLMYHNPARTQGFFLIFFHAVSKPRAKFCILLFKNRAKIQIVDYQALSGPWALQVIDSQGFAFRIGLWQKL